MTFGSSGMPATPPTSADLLALQIHLTVPAGFPDEIQQLVRETTAEAIAKGEVTGFLKHVLTQQGWTILSQSLNAIGAKDVVLHAVEEGSTLPSGRYLAIEGLNRKAKDVLGREQVQHAVMQSMASLGPELAFQLAQQPQFAAHSKQFSKHVLMASGGRSDVLIPLAPSSRTVARRAAARKVAAPPPAPERKGASPLI